MAGMLAATLSAGDAVRVRVDDGAGHDAILDGVVVRPMQIGADGTVNVQLQRPQYWSLGALSTRGMVSSGPGLDKGTVNAVISQLTVTNYSDPSARASLR